VLAEKGVAWTGWVELGVVGSGREVGTNYHTRHHARSCSSCSFLHVSLAWCHSFSRRMLAVQVDLLSLGFPVTCRFVFFTQLVPTNGFGTGLQSK
jgi:hypothetical protein